MTLYRYHFKNNPKRAAMKGRGRRVLCFTSRKECQENLDEMEADFAHWGVEVMPIIFCSAGSKQWTADQKGIRVDI